MKVVSHVIYMSLNCNQFTTKTVSNGKLNADITPIK
uniref:Uncharacterized protein n=1 Tax=Anguilla anguilla TaxID=7936 RepID=A0A0E9URR4_ANGAN